MMKERGKKFKTNIQLLFAATYVIIQIHTLLFCPRIFIIPRATLISLKEEQMGYMIEDATKQRLILAS